jgi:electron transfer flavoprotein alpha subunit
MSAAAVVVCTWGAPASDAEEALTLGRSVAAALGRELRWLVLGPLPEGAAATAGRFGAAGIDHADDPKLRSFQPDAYVAALAQYCAESPPRLLLFTQTFDARVAVPRLAARLGVGVVMNAVGIDADGGMLRVTASAFGGDTRTVYELGGKAPHLVALGANAVTPAPQDGAGTSPVVRQVALDLDGAAERIRVVTPPTREGPRLEDAQTIVAGGRGLGEAANFTLIEELAAALGGVAGASRPIVDDGWTDSSHQVGLTGKITRPALYIAAGISGASQHMVGCAAAKTIVAINRDADAAIFKHARWGVVGDCLAILPELIRAAKER